MQYKIEIDNSHLNRILKAVRKGIATPEEMLGSVGDSLVNVNRARHQAGLDPDGKPWKPLAASTLKQKRKGGILYSTGEMLNSINRQATGDTLRIGFDEPPERHLSIFHQFGTAPHLIAPLRKKALKFGGILAKRVNHPGLPARPLLGFPESDRQLTINVIEDHLRIVLKKAGA